MKLSHEQMKMFHSTYDVLEQIWEPVRKILEWESDTNITMGILAVCVVSSVVTLVGADILPVQLILLGGGIMMFLSNTVAFKIIMNIVGPIVLKGLGVELWNLKEGLEVVSKVPAGGMVDVKLFENQRWWLGRFYMILQDPF
jgi:hypothetical protein